MQLQLADLGWPQMPKMRETVMTDHNKELAEAFHKFGIRVERALKEAAANLKEALLNYELGDPPAKTTVHIKPLLDAAPEDAPTHPLVIAANRLAGKLNKLPPEGLPQPLYDVVTEYLRAAEDHLWTVWPMTNDPTPRDHGLGSPGAQPPQPTASEASGDDAFAMPPEYYKEALDLIIKTYHLEGQSSLIRASRMVNLAHDAKGGADLDRYRTILYGPKLLRSWPKEH